MNWLEKAHGVKLGMMSFFTSAAVEALERFPAVNTSIDGDDIVYHDYFDIGIAVSSERGLVVPIRRDADQLSYAEIEKSTREMGLRAPNGKLGIDELTGGSHPAPKRKVSTRHSASRGGFASDIGASITSGGGNGRMKDSKKLSSDRYQGASRRRENLITPL